MLQIRYPTANHKFIRKMLDFLKLFPLLALIKSRSYSQRAEDLLIRSKLQSAKGTYIDIGSGLPCWGNNTYALYKSGWSGILVDPIKRNIRLSRFFRRKDLSICAAVGQHEGTLNFYEFEPYELSTLNKEVYESLLKGDFGKFIESYDIPILTLRDLFQRIDLVRPIVLSIDTEGHEIQVLLGNDWNIFLPEIICIEEWQNPIKEKTDVRSFLESRGYELEMYNGLSAIYTRTN